jgi:hypothetical protein
MAESPAGKRNRPWDLEWLADRRKGRPHRNFSRLFFAAMTVDDIADHMSGIGHSQRAGELSD